LEDLIDCGFIRFYVPFGKKKKCGLYQLFDPFVLFNLNFVQQDIQEIHFWSNFYRTPSYNTWKGYAFELLCLHHLEQIKTKLQINVILTKVCSWRSTKGKGGAQIDLVLERRDGIVNLCELKYSSDIFEIDQEYEKKLQNKIELFYQKTKTTNACHLTMITTYGVKRNEYSGIVQSEVMMADLFRL